MRGRKPLPPNVKRLRGTDQPCRRKKPTEDPRNIGRCPTHLSIEERNAWRELVKTATPGSLALSDRIALECASKLLAETRTGEVSGSKQGLLINLLGKLGMTPDSRRHVQVPEPKETNPFDEP